MRQIEAWVDMRAPTPRQWRRTGSSEETRAKGEPHREKYEAWRENQHRIRLVDRHFLSARRDGRHQHARRGKRRHAAGQGIYARSGHGLDHGTQHLADHDGNEGLQLHRGEKDVRVRTALSGRTQKSAR